MALPASLTARLGELLDGTWTQIVADAAANNGNTVLTFTINITDNPAGGPVDYEIRYTHRFRTEVTQSASQTVTGTLS